jgi:hypothetical protein
MHPEDAMLAHAGCTALRIMADGGAPTVATRPGSALVASGGITAIVRAMNTHVAEPEVQVAAARA